MPRDPFRSSEGDLAYGDLPGPERRSQRWDSDRLAYERDRAREARDHELAIRDRAPPRDRSVDEYYERVSPRGFEEQRYHSDTRYYDDPPPPQRQREPEYRTQKQREYYRSPSPPPARRPSGNRPSFMRRQSSLDTFDRKPLYDRDSYAPLARRDDVRVNVNLNESREPPQFRRQLPPPRRYEEAYDDGYRYQPERIVREREIIRTRRRSRTQSRSRSRSSSSSASSLRSARTTKSSKSKVEDIRAEFPKRGKTRMPARLVHKEAIKKLGYEYKEEDDIIIIQQALGRDHIDEVIKLSSEYKAQKSDAEEKVTEVTKTKTTIIEAGPPPKSQSPILLVPPPPPSSHHRSRSAGPRIIETDVRRTEIIEAEPSHSQQMALIIPSNRKDDRAIRAEIKALEAEREALKAERRAEKELRRAEKLRYEGQSGELVRYERGGELIIYEEDDRRSRKESRREKRDDDVRVEKDRKGRMQISVKRARKRNTTQDTDLRGFVTPW